MALSLQPVASDPSDAVAVVQDAVVTDVVLELESVTSQP